MTKTFPFKSLNLHSLYEVLYVLINFLTADLRFVVVVVVDSVVVVAVVDLLVILAPRTATAMR